MMKTQKEVMELQDSIKCLDRPTSGNYSSYTEDLEAYADDLEKIMKLVFHQRDVLRWEKSRRDPPPPIELKSPFEETRF